MALWPIGGADTVGRSHALPMPLEQCCQGLLPVIPALQGAWETGDLEARQHCVVALGRLMFELRRALLIEALDLETAAANQPA